MFDIGFPELLIVTVVMLLVLGPERLPETLRMLGLWLGRLRRSFNAVKTEIEKEVGMDEIKRQLHNESIMEEMKRLESEVRGAVNEVENVGEAAAADTPSGPNEAHPKDIPAEPQPAAPASEAGPDAAGERSAQSS